MKGLVVLLVLAAAPAHGQSRVYTNADLGKPLAGPRPSAVEAAAIMAAHLPAPSPGGAAMDGPFSFAVEAERIGVPSGFVGSPSSFYGSFERLGPPRRLDGTFISDPVTIYGPPIWVGHGAYGYPGIAGPRGARSGPRQPGQPPRSHGSRSIVSRPAGAPRESGGVARKAVP